MSATAAVPVVPCINEVVDYDRVQPVFQSKKIPKERGDVLLALLDCGRVLKRFQEPPGMICALPIPPRLWIRIGLTNGANFTIGFSSDGGLVYLPTSLCEVADAPAKQIGRWMAEFEAKLRREILGAPKPCIYRIGTIDDGGTLSSVARFFYGDANKWRQVYEANREVIKNPDVVTGRDILTIPNLK